MLEANIVSIIIILHILIYSIPPFLGSFLGEEAQIILNYTYLGVLFALVQFFDSMYAISLSSEYSLNGGDIAYSALIFSTLYLMINQPKPFVVRNLIYIFIVNTFFLFILFGLLNQILASSYVINYLNISVVFLEFTLRSLFYSLFLFSSEILLFLYLIKQVKLRTTSSRVLTLSIVLIYIVIIIIDGMMYPLGINLLFPDSHLSIINGIIAKSIFGIGFGIVLGFLISFRPLKFIQFIGMKTPLIHYLIPPERFTLLQELEEAEEEIEQLKQIVPICAWCRKIRNDQGYWDQLEIFLSTFEDITFSHGVCPDCLDENYKKNKK